MYCFWKKIFNQENDIYYKKTYLFHNSFTKPTLMLTLTQLSKFHNNHYWFKRYDKNINDSRKIDICS